MFFDKSRKIIFLIIFTGSLLGLFLPWFLSVPGVTDYYWGWYGFQYEVIQILIIYFLCITNYNKPHAKLIVELLLITIPITRIFQMFHWYYKNVVETIELSYIVQTIQLNFWIAFIATIIPIICFPLLSKNNQHN